MTPKHVSRDEYQRQKRNAKIAELRESGMKLREIGELYGLSRQRILQIWLKETGRVGAHSA